MRQRLHPAYLSYFTIPFYLFDRLGSPFFRLMEYDSFMPSFRQSFRSDGDYATSEMSLISPTGRLAKRSLFSDLPLVPGGQYLQGYSPTQGRKQRNSHPYGSFGYMDLSAYPETCDDEEASNGPTPDLAEPSPSSPIPITSSSLRKPQRVRSDSQATEPAEYRSGCRGVSWNRRMKAWLAFWTEGKIRRSKTFNAKLLGFEQAKQHAIDFLRDKKAQLRGGGADSSGSSFADEDSVHNMPLEDGQQHFWSLSRLD